MPRFQNDATKVVVNVSDADAARLGAGWVELKVPPTPKPKRSAKK